MVVKLHNWPLSADHECAGCVGANRTRDCLTLNLAETRRGGLRGRRKMTHPREKGWWKSTGERRCSEEKKLEGALCPSLTAQELLPLSALAQMSLPACKHRRALLSAVSRSVTSPLVLLTVGTLMRFPTLAPPTSPVALTRISLDWHETKVQACDQIMVQKLGTN